jgi:hypothetical protein
VRNEFYKDTQGALLVFDCTSRRSFDALDAWHREATGFGAQNVCFALCGNKVPLARACAHVCCFWILRVSMHAKAMRCNIRLLMCQSEKSHVC